MSDKNSPPDGKVNATIIVAIISLCGTLIVAAITIWSNFLSEKRKQRTETEQLVKKYCDPLLFASQDLQSRLWGITQDYRLRWYYREDDGGQRKNDLIRYTCFLVGQFLSWKHILRRQAQFLDLGSDKKSLELTLALDSICRILGTTQRDPKESPFCLWRNEQLVIGELMTVKESNELFCISYAEFYRKWDGDSAFKGWFRSLEESIEKMASAERAGVTVPDHRLRRLQHKLIDLIHLLDPKNVWSDISEMKKCDPPSSCVCSDCDLNPAAPVCEVYVR